GTGATLGKLLVGLRVRMVSGSRCSFGAAALRELGWVADLFPYCLPILGLLRALQSPKRQRIGDRLAGTMVVTAARAGPGEQDSVVLRIVLAVVAFVFVEASGCWFFKYLSRHGLLS